jgi:hypothetical protein
LDKLLLLVRKTRDLPLLATSAHREAGKGGLCKEGREGRRQAVQGGQWMQGAQGRQGREDVGLSMKYEHTTYCIRE